MTEKLHPRLGQDFNAPARTCHPELVEQSHERSVGYALRGSAFVTSFYKSGSKPSMRIGIA
ncbi:MAG: hypothetical protein ACR2F0_04210 [Chthoniobacterales bacterium]